MRILGLLDQSLYGRSVIDNASWMAATHNAAVEILHVIPINELLANSMPVHPGGAVILAGDMTYDDAREERAIKGSVLLAEARTALISRGLMDVHMHIEEGNVVDLAVSSAETADLVIMGKRGENADLARLPLGSNVERVVRGCSVPVLVVSRAFRPIRKCLVAFDLDEASSSAVSALADRKLVPPMPVLLLHVGRADADLRGQIAEAGRRLEQAGYEVTTEVADGDPHRIIPERAVEHSVDLVLIGAFGASRLKSLIFGSLTSEVIRACQTPVLLTK